MKHTLYLVFLICFSCNSKTIKKDNIEDTFTRFIEPSDFHLKKIDFFDLRKWSYEERQEKLTELTYEDYKKYFQKKLMSKEFFSYSPHYYFSIQKNNTNGKIITILKDDDICCAYLHHLTFDENNKLKSNITIAETGGDGMWHYDKFGNFISDSTYQMIQVDIEEKELINGSAIVIDSSVSLYKINNRDSFIIIQKKEFQKIENH